MVSNYPLYGATAALLFWIGIWVIYSKARASRLSGFSFYLITGWITGLPFILWSILLLLSLKAAVFAFVVMILVSRWGALLAEDQEKKIRKAEPARWQRWEELLNAQNFIGRLFL
jgi:hypothetical protein